MRNAKTVSCNVFFVLEKINKIQVAGKNFWLVYYFATRIKSSIFGQTA